MIEYLEDLIELEPEQAFPQDVRTSGRYVQRTGDKLLDQWQEKAVSGEKIDFNEAFTTDEARKQFEKVKARSRQLYDERNQATKEAREAGVAVHDDFKAGG